MKSEGNGLCNRENIHADIVSYTTIIMLCYMETFYKKNATAPNKAAIAPCTPALAAPPV
jgi:hypothetical protein